jgi:hypothetical protein
VAKPTPEELAELRGDSAPVRPSAQELAELRGADTATDDEVKLRRAFEGTAPAKSEAEFASEGATPSKQPSLGTKSVAVGFADATTFGLADNAAGLVSEDAREWVDKTRDEAREENPSMYRLGQAWSLATPGGLSGVAGKGVAKLGVKSAQALGRKEAINVAGLGREVASQGARAAAMGGAGALFSPGAAAAAALSQLSVPLLKAAGKGAQHLAVQAIGRLHNAAQAGKLTPQLMRQVASTLPDAAAKILAQAAESGGG